MLWSKQMEPIVSEDRNYDWSQCSLVESVPGKVSGAPVLVGTRMPVQAIVDNFDGGMEPSEIAEQWRLKLSDVEAILTFREQLYARTSRQ